MDWETLQTILLWMTGAIAILACIQTVEANWHILKDMPPFPLLRRLVSRVLAITLMSLWFGFSTAAWCIMLTGIFSYGLFLNAGLSGMTIMRFGFAGGAVGMVWGFYAAASGDIPE